MLTKTENSETSAEDAAAAIKGLATGFTEIATLIAGGALLFTGGVDLAVIIAILSDLAAIVLVVLTSVHLGMSTLL